LGIVGRARATKERKRDHQEDKRKTRWEQTIIKVKSAIIEAFENANYTS